MDPIEKLHSFLRPMQIEEDFDPVEVAIATIEELQSWQTVAIDSYNAIDAYLREVNPILPEHYGMPVDGIRRTLEYVRDNLETS